jgi:gelsolin
LFDLFQGAAGYEHDMSERIWGIITPDTEPNWIAEGSEPQEFWDALGGKGEYDTELDKPGPPFLDPRLFHCRILTNGKFRVSEINNFEQDDLDVDDIMVLDGGDEIYVWEGEGSTDEEKAKSLDMAQVCVL